MTLSFPSHPLKSNNVILYIDSAEKRGRKEMLHNLFYKDSITQIPKLNQSITRKENHTSMSFKCTDTEIFICYEIFAYQIQSYEQIMAHHDHPGSTFKR